MKLPISEIFYSLQGEGLTMGYPAVFMRLGGCNLMCGGQGTQSDKELHNGATWRCDTIEVWMQSQSMEYQDFFDDKCQAALKSGAHLVITGGEPLLHQDKLIEIIDHIRADFGSQIWVEVETNGTIMPEIDLQIQVDQWNCSPKLSNSGNNKSIRFQPEVLKGLSERYTQFKFVIHDEKDLEEIDEDFLEHIREEQIWLMPAGESQDQLAQTKALVAEICITRGYRFSTRMHIDLWNKKTGV